MAAAKGVSRQGVSVDAGRAGRAGRAEHGTPGRYHFGPEATFESAADTDLLITGGKVIDPATKTAKVMDIAVHRGVIVAMGKKIGAIASARVIDASGLLVTPGLIDPHVHLREPGNERAETIASGTKAAVAGGFTTLCCMPNTTPALDSDAMVRFVLDRTQQTGRCRVFPVAAATKGRKGEELAEIGLMHRAGAVGFSDDGDCVMNASVMQRILVTVRAAGSVFMQHCQDHQLSKGGVMHAGVVSTRLGLGGWPRAAEELIIDRDVRLNSAIGCNYHVQHLSSGGSVEIVRTARKAGLPVTAEASPHHLLLTCDLIETTHGGYDTRLKMNPPLREQSDIDAIKRGIADGTITHLATDHAPHTHESKQVPFDIATFGIIGLETALGLYAHALIDGGVITWPRLIELLTLAPATLCGLDQRGLGKLAIGGPADITLIDPEMAWTISPADLAGQSVNTPFVGRRVKGRAIMTIVAGRVAMELARG